ncbi:hypothetical protein GCM10023238_38630 [Streptomyces heliomycini]
MFDAVVDPTQTMEQGSLAQARGFQLALDDYAEDCVAGTEECPVGDSAQDVKNRIAELLEDLDRTHPSPASPRAHSPRPRRPAESCRRCTRRTSGSSSPTVSSRRTPVTERF